MAKVGLKVNGKNTKKRATASKAKKASYRKSCLSHVGKALVGSETSKKGYTWTVSKTSSRVGKVRVKKPKGYAYHKEDHFKVNPCYSENSSFSTGSNQGEHGTGLSGKKSGGGSGQ